MATSATFSVLLSIVLFLFVADIFAAAPYVNEYEQNIENRIEKVMREYMSWKSTKTEKVQLTGFEWHNCGGTMEKVTLLSLKPDPIKFPGKLNISAVFDILEDLNAPLKAQVTIAKEIDNIWINIPCLGNFGSCVYDDICAMLAPVVCPDQIKDCHCPFKKGVHTIKYPEIDIGAAVLPSGKYNATGILYKEDGKKLACLTIGLSVA